ncbi:MAG TPA: hypothetical protein VN201_10410 [Roseateles sp.]|nr:hypothetical protein [Roseateles sp.]
MDSTFRAHRQAAASSSTVMANARRPSDASPSPAESLPSRTHHLAIAERGAGRWEVAWFIPNRILILTAPPGHPATVGYGAARILASESPDSVTSAKDGSSMEKSSSALAQAAAVDSGGMLFALP